MKSAKKCPWCKETPKLIRKGDRSDTGWIYACLNSRCPVQPALKDYCIRESEALQLWNEGV